MKRKPKTPSSTPDDIFIDIDSLIKGIATGTRTIHCWNRKTGRHVLVHWKVLLQLITEHIDNP